MCIRDSYETSLANLIENRAKLSLQFSEEDIIKLVTAIASAAAFLQKHLVNHGDIRPASIFLAKDTDANYKLVDTLGLPAYNLVRFGKVNTLPYLSPALLTSLGQKQLSPTHDYKKSEVFSLGMTALHMATPTPTDSLYTWSPPALNTAELNKRLEEISGKYSKGLTNLLKDMLDLDENRRIDFATLEGRLHANYYNLGQPKIEEPPKPVQVQDILATQRKESQPMHLDVDRTPVTNKSLEATPESSDYDYRKERRDVPGNHVTLIDTNRFLDELYQRDYSAIQANASPPSYKLEGFSGIKTDRSVQFHPSSERKEGNLLSEITASIPFRNFDNDAPRFSAPPLREFLVPENLRNFDVTASVYALDGPDQPVPATIRQNDPLFIESTVVPYNFPIASTLPHQKPQPQVERYADGSHYIGEKQDGVRHGKGSYYYSDGGRYEGEWKHDMMDGKGTLYYEGGSKAYEGDWKADQFHGKGTLYNEKPQEFSVPFDFKDFDKLKTGWLRYEGDFVKDNKEGLGVLFLSNGEKYVGQFRDDLIHGIGTFFKKDGGTISGEWTRNKQVKEYQSYTV
eukprot:TRINITY_DN6737_c0_g1_i1.p1 TRINITY_DN6737_c0_g1~~TRINITY_DN6737_c0_g1_i1.p1  ORF type:complete len:601 (+),score=128.08 TRINITY_DN6737_c0_g1_i1:95-1804(+)